MTTPTDHPGLTAADLAFAYEDTPVLSAVTADFAPARITAVVGPNGAGKTTLLRLLLGLLKPDSGSAALDGRPVRTIPAPDRARRLAFVPQRPDAAFGFTVAQTVAFARHAARPAVGPDPHAVSRALTRLELAHRAHEPFTYLSTGQQQRAALARALAQLDRPNAPPADLPRYLLADEPVSAMDPRHAARALALVRTLATDHGVGVVIVLHDLTAARAVADDALLLDAAGRPAAAGPAQEVLTPAALEPVFETPFLELTHPNLPTPALVPAPAAAPDITGPAAPRSAPADPSPTAP